MSRFLLVSASMGAGHDTVAAELARRLEAAGHETARADVLALLPHGTGAALRGFYRSAVRHAPAVYAGLYAVFFRSGTGPRPGSAPLAALAEERLLARVTRWRADAVVPVFHLAAQLTGRLRSRGALSVPAGVVVTDFALHRQWLHPGNDLTMCLTAESARQAQRSTGRAAAVSGPMVSDRFRPSAPGAQAWRRDLGRDGRDPVLLSAGAWGTGTGLRATARLLSAAGYRPVVLCGRDTRLRRRLLREPGVLALGWTDDVPGLMAVSRALVDNAAGQTAVEALATGVPVIGYRPIPGHGADGVRRMAALGLSDHAEDSWRLLRSVDRLTASGEARNRRIRAGLALFAGDAVPHLEALAAGRRGWPRLADPAGLAGAQPL